MQDEKWEQFLAIAKEYIGEDEDRACTIGTLRAVYGEDYTISAIKEANGRDIDIIYGEGYDNVVEIRFVDRGSIERTRPSQSQG